MQFTRPALSRPMDWSYRSNRFIVLVTPVVGTIAGLVALARGESLWDSAWWGYFAAGASFLAWTIARELHPDRAWIATVAVLVAPAGLLWGRSDLLASASVLLVVRTVAGTTGRSLRWTDLLLLGAVGGPIVVRDSGPAALVVGAIGLFVTVVWHDRRRWLHLVAGLLYALGGAIAIALADSLSLLDGGGRVLLWIGVAAGAISLVGPGRVSSVEDRRGGAPVRAFRVRVARLVAFATAAAVSLTFDPAAMAPVWAALVATALHPR